jgi:uncharacterized damage-inducible protein DinB
MIVLMIPPPDYFIHLYEYVKWADLRQLESTRPLSDDEYFKDRGWSFGNIHKVQLHELSAQSVWLDRFVGNKPIWVSEAGASVYSASAFAASISRTS